MSHGVPGFCWREGRPRWIASARLRALGAKGVSLQDADGQYLDLRAALSAAREINRKWGVVAPARPAKPQPKRERSGDHADSGYVYFVAVGSFVKIGWSSQPFGRAADVDRGQPEPPNFILVCRGGRFMETLLHRTFRRHRVKGEWFRRSPELDFVMVEAVVSGGLDLVALERLQDLQSHGDAVRRSEASPSHGKLK